jgi:hypothetical protein
MKVYALLDRFDKMLGVYKTPEDAIQVVDEEDKSVWDVRQLACIANNGSCDHKYSSPNWLFGVREGMNSWQTPGYTIVEVEIKE